MTPAANRKQAVIATAEAARSSAPLAPIEGGDI